MTFTDYNYATRDEWLADRINFIGASEVASVLNIPGAYGSRFDLWLKKTGRAPGTKETEGMRWGHRMEPVIAQAVQEDHGGSVALMGDTCTGPKDKPHHRATLDALWSTGEGGTIALELKNVGEYMREEWTGDAPPAAYYCQVQWQLYCTGLKRGAIAALIGGNRLVLHGIDRNDEEIGVMVAAVDAFWGMVKRDTAPDPTAKDLPAMKYRWQEKRGDCVQLPADVLEEYAEAADVYAAAGDRLDEAKLSVQTRMAEATEGQVGDVTAFTWRENKNGTRTFRVTKAGTELMERLTAKESAA